MSERDQRRQLAVGAGTSPADPGGQPLASPADGDVDADAVRGVVRDVDVVQAVAALVSDLVEASDDPLGDTGDLEDIGAGAAPAAIDVGQEDLAQGPVGTHGDAVAPGPDRGGTTVGPTAR